MTTLQPPPASGTATPWQLAQRTTRMNPSVIREILKLTEQPGVISLAGGLPSPDSFPVEAMREATARVLRDAPREALQYAASEGFAPLREWVAAHLAEQGMHVDASQVLITTGSQQGLDLVGKVLIDAGSTVAVEAPTYLGALQAFTPYEPEVITVPCDDDGPRPESLGLARGARFLYVLPNFQNPSGRCMSEARRAALVDAARAIGLPLVEDNPYGDLWFDAPPPAPLAARWPKGTVYLGSFSKVLAPGLRLGYVVAPHALMPKLLQAKQAADLHTPGFNQRVVYEVIRDGFLRNHVPTIRARYKAQRDAMRAALEAHMPAGCHWTVPHGGMFFWVELPDPIDATALLPAAVALGMAYVPGAAFFASDPKRNTLRLSFVTVAAPEIDRGVALLAQALRAAIAGPAPGRSQAAPHPHGGLIDVPVDRGRTFTQVDVFTATPLLGNALAVVHDAQGLSDSQMQAFARWTNLSETTFLLPPTDAVADYRVRIFTPGGELPFAGHPTLGSCHAWLEAGGAPRAAGEVVQQCGVGLVRIRREGARCAFAAPPLQVAEVDNDLLGSVLAALGLSRAQVQAASWLDNGPKWLGLLLDDAATVLAIEPDHAVLKGLAKVGVVGPHAAGTECQFEVRAFAPSIGVPEDPVTGSLNAGLAQWLIGSGAAPASYVAAQGSRLGRAGRVHIALEAGTLWVGGSSVSCIRGEVVL
jgi:2-aminoadipate transaminase